MQTQLAIKWNRRFVTKHSLLNIEVNNIVINIEALSIFTVGLKISPMVVRISVTVLEKIRLEGLWFHKALGEGGNTVIKQIASDCHMMDDKLETSFNSSRTRMHSILYGHLKVKKTCSQRIPYNLSQVEKDAWIKWW